MVEALVSLGAGAEPTPDGMIIEGTGSIEGGVISSHGDHRIAMLGAVAGIGSRSGVVVKGFEAASVSYPLFDRDLESLVATG